MVGARHFLALARDENGAAMIEMVIVINLVVLVIVAFVELSVAVNQWNLAAKAVQIGARLAAVSSPIDSSLVAWTGLSDTVNPGDPIPANGGFDSVCSGATRRCTCTGGLGCTYDSDAMSRLVFGSDGVCTAASGTRIGMCDVLPSGPAGGIQTDKVV